MDGGVVKGWLMLALGWHVTYTYLQSCVWSCKILLNDEYLLQSLQ